MSDREPIIFGKHRLSDFNPKVGQNPMIQWFGLGPVNRTCETCKHLYIDRDGDANPLPKCAFRAEQPGEQLKGWPACAKYEEKYGRV